MGSSKNARRDRRKQPLPSNEMDIYDFKTRNQTQDNLIDTLNHKTVTLVTGPAGTGKTLIGLSYGMGLLNGRAVDQFIYVRSDIGMEGQRGRGHLPGEYLEKVMPLLYPVLDNLRYICPNPRNTLEYMLRVGKFEVVLLEDIRGRSFNNSFILCDEAQNMSPDQFKTVISRVGTKSTIMLCGDTSQADSASFRINNGLSDAITRLRGLYNVGVVSFTADDIIRNSALQNILSRY